MKKYLLLTIITLVLCANAINTKVKIENPKLMEFSKELTLPGDCVYQFSKDFIATSQSYVSVIPENNKVNYKKGELIFAMDYELSKASTDQAESDFKASSLNFERDKKLFSKNFISEADLEQSKVKYYLAKSNFEAAKKSFEDKVIYAPFDGAVSTVKFNIGEQVNQGDFILNITSPGPKSIRFFIPEQYKIDPAKAAANILYKNKSYPLDLLSISNAISSDKSSYISTGIVNGDNNLEHNSYVSVNITYDIHKGVGIPELAVFVKDGNNNVFIVDENNKAKQVVVELADRKNEYVEVISNNIPESSKIVTEGIQKLNDGSSIEIIK